MKVNTGIRIKQNYQKTGMKVNTGISIKQNNQKTVISIENI